MSGRLVSKWQSYLNVRSCGQKFIVPVAKNLSSSYRTCFPQLEIGNFFFPPHFDVSTGLFLFDSVQAVFRFVR